MLITCAQDLATALGASRSGSQYVHKCPAHEDNKASLTFKDGEKLPVVVNCHTGCSPKGIYQAFAAAGIKFADKRAEQKLIVDKYDYQNADGTVRYQKLRYEPKDFRLRQSDGAGGWIWSLKGVEEVLYKLPQIDEAIFLGDPIFVVEGEKDANNLADLGLAATTNTHGASKSDKPKWTAKLSELLVGASQVFVLPDNDESGKQHGRAVERMLTAVHVPVKIVHLPGLLEKEDVTDWLGRGGTKEQLLEICRQPSAEVMDFSVPTADPIAEPAVAELDDFHVRAWPTLRPEALHGPAGRIVRAAVESSEADPAAVLGTLLVRCAATFGRHSWTKVGDDRHYPLLYGMVVGASGQARKGTSLSPIVRLFKDAEPRLDGPPLRVTNGLSSGEGVIAAIRDPQEKKDDEEQDQGVTDKRLLVIETEFAGPLRAMQRQGNTLSVVLRDAWDRDRLCILTKNNPLSATDIHVCVLGHITRKELGNLLEKVELSNGLVNRFLWFCSRRSKVLPFPQGLNELEIPNLSYEITQAVKFAQRDQQIDFAPEAMSYYEELYLALAEEDGSGMIGDITARGAAQIRRLSLIYCLLDCSSQIRTEHLVAAKAVWDYCLASAKLIFGSEVEDNYDSSSLGQRIMTALKTGEQSQQALYRRFQNSANAKKLGAALSELQSIGKVSQRRGESSGGRAPILWSLAAERRESDVV